MKNISSWANKAQTDLNAIEPLLEKNFLLYKIRFILTQDSLWAKVIYPKGGGVALRMCYIGGDNLYLKDCKEKENKITFLLDSTSKGYVINVELLYKDSQIIHYSTEITPKIPLLLPFYPKDILPLTTDGKIQQNGKIHIKQIGTRSGLLFMSMNQPRTGSLFYFQNLTSLNKFCEATKTSAGDLISDQWPEIGFALPCTNSEPLLPGEIYVISDAYIALSEEIPVDDYGVSKQFLDHLASVYIELPKPKHKYHHWPDIAEKSIADLEYHKGCWTHAGGHNYLNAYVGDYKTPAEIMVQLAVLIPMLEYCEWDMSDNRIIKELENGLQAFYAEDLKSIVRWLPQSENRLDGSEEQKQVRIMDSWYLYHPLMNLARLTKRGSKIAQKLLMDSIDYAINVAHHFSYNWPVFYRMDTLYVIKAEIGEGQGGEHDVAGIYANLMLEMWDLTREKKYFNEAKKAAKTLSKHGVDIFYQANTTAFSAGALLRLYKETKDKEFLDLAYCCIAGIFKNVRIWECTYGHGKHYPNFFAIFPLNDAPYTAAYEEQEVYAALTNFLKEAEGIEILPSVRLLIAELAKYTITRVPYYFPPLLPKEMIAGETKTGEVDNDLWIALEDLQDGWKSSGEVGQEVYGAGIAFGILPRQFVKIKNEDFIIFIDYPTTNLEIKKQSVSFKILGDNRMECKVAIHSESNITRRSFKLIETENKINVNANKKTSKEIEFIMRGDSRVKLSWDRKA